jgi:hypothetical protein
MWILYGPSRGLAAACSGPRTDRAQGVVQEGVLERRWLLVQSIRAGMLTTALTEDHSSHVRLPLTTRVSREFCAGTGDVVTEISC